MVSAEVQRTLVKSPPELWSELSDPASLARHLGELGEIRITRTEPEQLIEWEADGTTGTVAITASGWGTRVTLSVSRELPAPGLAESPADDVVDDALPAGRQDIDTADAEPRIDTRDAEPPPRYGAAEPVPEQGLAVAAQPATAQDRPAPAPDAKPAPVTEAARRAAGWPASGAAVTDTAVEGDLEGPAHPEVTRSADPPDLANDELEPASEAPPHEPRRSFFARLFRRRRHAAPDDAPLAETEPAVALEAPEPQASQPSAIEHEPAAVVDQEAEDERPVAQAYEALDAAASPDAGPTPDLAAELEAAEEVAAEEVAAVLTSVLDRLGAAHHRPFSRA